jgi:hypothetical protein
MALPAKAVAAESDIANRDASTIGPAGPDLVLSTL